MTACVPGQCCPRTNVPQPDSPSRQSCAPSPGLSMVDNVPAEEFHLTEGAAVTCALSLVRHCHRGRACGDGISEVPVQAVMTSSPDDGPAPLHLVKADQDAG